MRQLSDSELAVVAAAHGPLAAADYVQVIEDDFRLDSSGELHVFTWAYEEKVALLLAIAKYGPRPH